MIMTEQYRSVTPDQPRDLLPEHTPVEGLITTPGAEGVTAWLTANGGEMIPIVTVGMLEDIIGDKVDPSMTTGMYAFADGTKRLVICD